MKKLSIGLTLIELMITVLIIAILTITATTIYSSYVRKSRRMDALNAMIGISLAEERYRSNNTQYGTLVQVWNSVSTSTEGYYTLAISNISATSYTVTATATGTQANDSANGTSCATLTLAMSNGVITKTPAACWSN